MGVMQPDDHVCLCFHVSQRKLVTWMNLNEPRVASQLSECMSAGTGCQWCVPYLTMLFEQWRAGEEPNLPLDPEAYRAARKDYRQTRQRKTLME
jgi:bacterioferritin-associated ferredoxin